MTAALTSSLRRASSSSSTTSSSKTTPSVVNSAKPSAPAEMRGFAPKPGRPARNVGWRPPSRLSLPRAGQCFAGRVFKGSKPGRRPRKNLLWAEDRPFLGCAIREGRGSARGGIALKQIALKQVCSRLFCFCPVANVAAVIHAVELDFGHGVVSLPQRFIKSRPRGGNPKHSAP